MLLLLLAVMAFAEPFHEAERWSAGTLGALTLPWVVASDDSDELVAVLDGAGRVTLYDAGRQQVRFRVSVVRATSGVVGAVSFGPRGLAVVAGPRDGELRVAILDPQTGRLEALGRTPAGARVLDLRWLETGELLTRTREPDPSTPVDGLFERRWGPKPSGREVGAWFPHRRVKSARSDRVFVDTTTRSLDRGGRLAIKVNYQVWDDPWDPSSARRLKSCPEWSEVVHVSEDGRMAYTMGQIRCVYDLDEGEVIAWETKQAPFWSAIAPDGSTVVERHGRVGRRYGVVRAATTGEVLLELDDLEGATYTPDAGLLVWGAERLRVVNLADGAVRWSVPVHGSIQAVHPAPDAGAFAVVEREQGRTQLRVIGNDGRVRATLPDVRGFRGFSATGKLLFVEARPDHVAVLDLRSPVPPPPTAHLAPISALVVDDRGVVLSGDEEGRFRRAREHRAAVWTMQGEVRGLALDDSEVVALAVEPQTEEGPFAWRVARQPLRAEDRGRDALVARDAPEALLASDGSDVLLLGEFSAALAPAGRGRARSLPRWVGRDGGPGPDAETAVRVPGRDRVIAVARDEVGDRAYAWSWTKTAPVATYALGLGTPRIVAADARQVLVLDARGSGRIFGGEAKGGVDLALTGSSELCCGAIGGGTVALVTSRGVLHLYLADTGAHHQSFELRLRADPTAVAVSPGGRFVAVGSEAGDVVLFRQGE
ncbi:MAG: hypothetical protein EA397_00260 [Deltaproteobacteria bacterium]|nr:MAG: hypothetical protein EA397_00260 [Deltaproteobacteria bacterium]